MYYGTYQRLGLHVSASYREVIRAARRKLTKKGKSRAQRRERHHFLRHMLDYHRNARKLYRSVMNGSL